MPFGTGFAAVGDVGDDERVFRRDLAIAVWASTDGVVREARIRLSWVGWHRCRVVVGLKLATLEARVVSEDNRLPPILDPSTAFVVPPALS